MTSLKSRKMTEFERRTQPPTAPATPGPSAAVLLAQLETLGG